MAVTVELVISGKLIGNAVMAKPKLNPRQKRWLNKFLKEHPEYKLREVWDGLGGDRYLRLEAIEWLPMPSILEFADATPGYRSSTLIAQLRKYFARKFSTMPGMRRSRKREHSKRCRQSAPCHCSAAAYSQRRTEAL
jgi:hypothetical protein